MDEGSRGLEVVHDVDRRLDAHTHLTGQENAVKEPQKPRPSPKPTETPTKATRNDL